MESLPGLGMAVSLEATVRQKLGGKEEDNTVAEGSFWEHRYAYFLIKCIPEKKFCNMRLTEKAWQEICPFL